MAAPQQPAYQPQPQSYAGGYGGGAAATSAPSRRKEAGYFRALFDLSYNNLGAAKFARVFQLLFMILSALAYTIAILVIVLDWDSDDSELPLILALVVIGGLIAWLLLNTLVRLLLEGVVGIVQSAENTERMLELMELDNSV